MHVQVRRGRIKGTNTGRDSPSYSTSALFGTKMNIVACILYIHPLSLFPDDLLKDIHGMVLIITSRTNSRWIDASRTTVACNHFAAIFQLHQCTVIKQCTNFRRHAT